MAARVSQDHLFEVALSAIPEALSSGLRAAGLADPGLLDVYPRDSFGKLVAAETRAVYLRIWKLVLWLQVVRRWTRVSTTTKAVHTHPYRF